MLRQTSFSSSKTLACVPALLGLVLAACASGCALPSDDDDDGDVGVSDESALVAHPELTMPPALDADGRAAVLANYTNVDPTKMIAKSLREDALVFYDHNKAALHNKGHLAVVDFSLNSGKKRLFVVDVTTGKTTGYVVAHGSGSEDGHGNAKYFSNVDGSHKSSLGYYVTSSVYYGSHGRSLLLDGLSSTNSNVRAREIVMHPADYVKEGRSRQGNSWGCFAVDPSERDTLINALQNGAVIYANLEK